mmetsp:Transcript_406/g.1196  ORF Transcript_406/g.1196 Transcript_406/m.1196 type:complete len:365 (-) Transcript_406:309-1403(-)
MVGQPLCKRVKSVAIQLARPRVQFEDSVLQMARRRRPLRVTEIEKHDRVVRERLRRARQRQHFRENTFDHVVGQSQRNRKRVEAYRSHSVIRDEGIQNIRHIIANNELVSNRLLRFAFLLRFVEFLHEGLQKTQMKPRGGVSRHLRVARHSKILKLDFVDHEKTGFECSLRRGHGQAFPVVSGFLNIHQDFRKPLHTRCNNVASTSALRRERRKSLHPVLVFADGLKRGRHVLQKLRELLVAPLPEDLHAPRQTSHRHVQKQNHSRVHRWPVPIIELTPRLRREALQQPQKRQRLEKPRVRKRREVPHGTTGARGRSLLDGGVEEIERVCQNVRGEGGAGFKSAEKGREHRVDRRFVGEFHGAA